MTKSKSIRLFPQLMVGLLVLFATGVSLVLTDNRNNPVVDGRTVETWLTILQRGNYEERRQAEQALVDNKELSLSGLIHFLERNPNPIHVAGVEYWNRFSSRRLAVPDYSGRQAAAARVLGRMGTNGVAATRALMTAAVTPNWNVSEPARQALSQLGASVAPDMANRLGRSDPVEHQLKWTAILKGMGSNATNAIGDLTHALTRSSPELRAKILGIFEQTSFHVPAATGVLIDAAAGGDVPTRCAALRSLGRYESVDARMRVVIDANLNHEDFSVRFSAACARCRLDDRPEAVLPIVIEGLQHGEHRVAAVSVLGDLRAVAEPAIPDLIEALVQERNPRPLRNPPAAGVALSRIGNRSIPFVIQLLGHDDPATQLNAVVTLGVFRKRAYEAADSLRPLLHHPSEEVREATALTLASIGYHTREAVPVLLILREGDDPFTATWASDALLKIDTTLPDADPAR